MQHGVYRNRQVHPMAARMTKSDATWNSCTTRSHCRRDNGSQGRRYAREQATIHLCTRQLRANCCVLHRARQTSPSETELDPFSEMRESDLISFDCRRRHHHQCHPTNTFAYVAGKCATGGPYVSVRRARLKFTVHKHAPRHATTITLVFAPRAW